MKRLSVHGKNSSTSGYASALGRLENFYTGGALRGRAVEVEDSTVYTTGMLPPEWAQMLKSDVTASYVIWSYDTPIAWYSEIQCGWVIPDVSYSPTTSKHQGIVRRAVS